MGGFLEPSPQTTEHDNSKRTIVVAIAVIVAVTGLVALALRAKPKPPAATVPYAVNLKFSDLKLSQAQNFVGGSVTYVDGTIANTGDKTITHATVRVTFKDLYDQVAQIEEVPLKVLRTTGPYPDTADLSIAPLAPGQTNSFRLIFEHVSDQWNQAYPELRVTDVMLK